MQEPFDAEVARGHVQAILDGPGMTVFSKRVKDDLVKHDMTSQDAINVMLGGRISATKGMSGWRYRARTARMTVLFSFRGHRPDEVVLEAAWRSER